MVLALVSRAPQLAPDLHFQLLVGREAPLPLSDAANVSYKVVNAAANGPGTQWWLGHLVDLRDVDVFHATFNILPAGLSMPSLTTVHDIMWLTRPDLCESGWKRPIRQAFFAHGLRRAIRKSSLIATVSEATRSALVDLAPDVAHRTVTTRSGVDPVFRPVNRDAQSLEAMGLSADRRYILTVGQFAPYKNHDGAIRAFALACSGRDDIDLVLVQRQGRDAAGLLRLAESLGVQGRVRLLRPVSLGALIQLYSAAELLLHPSYYEGFGHPLAEAMACGCPVVTSDRSAMPEVCGATALLADPHDPAAIAACINLVLDTPQLASAMRTKGLERAAALRWEDFAEANLTLYRRLLANHN